MPNFNAGDVIIDSLMMTGEKGVANLGGLVVEASVFESIFEKGMTALIELIDTEGILSTLGVYGGELVYFKFKSPDGPEFEHTFTLNSIKVSRDEEMKCERYVLNLVSPESVNMRSTYVSREFETTISNIMQQVHSMFSSRPLFTEPTDGVQKFWAPNEKAMRILEMVRRRGVSTANKSSTFLYFENREGWHFKTMEGMFRQRPVKELIQSDAVGYYGPFDDIMKHQILGYEIEHMVNTVARASLGGLKQTVKTFDLETLAYETLADAKEITDSALATGGKSMITAAMRARHGGKPGLISVVPRDRRNPNPKMAEATPDQMAFTSSMVQAKVKLVTVGDTLITAGCVVNTKIPTKHSLTETTRVNELINGPMLVSKVRHHIGQPQTRPRYKCVIEALKGGYEGEQ